jgi:hypothetical protein
LYTAPAIFKATATAVEQRHISLGLPVNLRWDLFQEKIMNVTGNVVIEVSGTASTGVYPGEGSAD